MKNLIENILIARICHDLITPCNAINLGLEAYEMSEDKGLLTCIKDSAVKANVVLKFMRELFLDRNDQYRYTVHSLQKIISEFLNVYNIECNLVTNCSDLINDLGRIIMFDTVVMKEIMPMGGKVIFNVGEDFITIIYSGNGILEFDTTVPQQLTYKNVLRYKLLDLLKNKGFSINSIIENGEGKIREIKS